MTSSQGVSQSDKSYRAHNQSVTGSQYQGREYALLERSSSSSPSGKVALLVCSRENGGVAPHSDAGDSAHQKASSMPGREAGDSAHQSVRSKPDSEAGEIDGDSKQADQEIRAESPVPFVLPKIIVSDHQPRHCLEASIQSTREMLRRDLKFSSYIRLGSGTSGSAYLCGIDGGRTVVYKEIIPSEVLKHEKYYLASGPSGAPLARGEALALEFSEHENLLKTHCLFVFDKDKRTCRVIDSSTQDKSPHEVVVGTITEALDRAEDLQSVVKNSSMCGGYSPPKDLQSFTRGIAGAVDAMHQKGLAHRDIKTQNILRYKKPSGEVGFKLIDFGYTRNTTGTNGRVDTFCGTPNNLAPEICIKEEGGYDPMKADAWSLGIALYYYAFGENPSHCNSERTPLQIFIKAFLINERLITIRSSNSERMSQLPPDHPYAHNKDFWDLLSKLVCPVEQRLSMAEVMSHPFCKTAKNDSEVIVSAASFVAGGNAEVDPSAANGRARPGLDAFLVAPASGSEI